MKKIAENDICNFYDNEMTGTYKGYRILVAENKKTKDKDYIASKDGKVIVANPSIEAVWCKIDFINMV